MTTAPCDATCVSRTSPMCSSRHVGMYPCATTASSATSTFAGVRVGSSTATSAINRLLRTTL
eukprot:1587094-Prymnesium_polylepis.2